ncbi:2-amino-4-hydroxy-6-hydroxymethyldihydropteridine diphosphokinase [Photobacterium ganghwense]|uniref:2-amino-4-hydroxy-6-hydroxymethyldihydropteridine pyrophosphokinase n=1 Tax=Photobacterium ganghwense TaxID=320778 RepID=A0A0J1JVI9_9GAMM|nr:2-amino-4-hydroxy-6-hydroxymethyldihydropteridine diphosphokinase [Photobacterium ganghwense]KLV06312.1 2-amino-4-hydroxy-6-hydroxymethyldihydropteridine pyrophosphokinase [Photobacterium ganghwense]PSU06677.1 2-amino-4-hydroxy-6-hydroxymethyldihydropteridine diphosphokinase [Photobacterium ganghwense]QSV14478.1 2-amino-4-hydroxy-6-hydroxymethyldihydropteridine diphosphokinase [Photobacterium ganghwense]
MIRAYIAIGSNLADPISQARRAIDALQQHPDLTVVAVSSLYSSTPMGPQDQPDYINAVVAVDTELAPLALLDCTQAIEQEHGRVRKAERWGPRTLDLDIILYGDLIHQCERLTVPHYGMKVREFVLYPLAEIAPELILPDHTRLQSLLAQVDRNGLTVWSD